MTRGDGNKIDDRDRPAHDWYRFVLSFPPHLVRAYLDRFGIDARHRVLDPFCGAGTTIVECKKLGIPSVGVEASPFTHFAAQVKIDWSPDPDALLQHSEYVAERARAQLEADGIEDDPVFPSMQRMEMIPRLRTLEPDVMRLLLKNSISPLPLHKVLVLLDTLKAYADERFERHQRLALAKALHQAIGNLHFGPEVGVGPVKVDAPVIATWLDVVSAMARDLRCLKPLNHTDAMICHADARSIGDAVEPASIDAVITSPPYPNEKDYTRTTRLESVLLGFIRSASDLRALKHLLLRSNTRNVYASDDDDRWIAHHLHVQRLADMIEARRRELGKTSGFERLYARVARLYFGGMARHFATLRAILRPGAHLAYVVGDQASYFRVMIPTGALLSDIAQQFGYETVGIDLFRTRIATATRMHLREEVVVLRWTGQASP